MNTDKHEFELYFDTRDITASAARIFSTTADIEGNPWR
jgi:hypothetical protein